MQWWQSSSSYVGTGVSQGGDGNHLFVTACIITITLTTLEGEKKGTKPCRVWSPVYRRGRGKGERREGLFTLIHRTWLLFGAAGSHATPGKFRQVPPPGMEFALCVMLGVS